MRNVSYITFSICGVRRQKDRAQLKKDATKQNLTFKFPNNMSASTNQFPVDTRR